MSNEEAFVNELVGYIFAYPDDDYMTMECLCRKLHKHGLIERKDGEWTTDFIDRKTEPQTETDRPQGEWIDVTNGRGGHECSNCHRYAPSYMSGDEHLSDYCPSCGAHMKGADDEN